MKKFSTRQKLAMIESAYADQVQASNRKLELAIRAFTSGEPEPINIGGPVYDVFQRAQANTSQMTTCTHRAAESMTYAAPTIGLLPFRSHTCALYSLKCALRGIEAWAATAPADLMIHSCTVCSGPMPVGTAATYSLHDSRHSDLLVIAACGSCQNTIFSNAPDRSWWQVRWV